MDWKPEYEIGIELIDEQHKELIRRISLFHEACELGVSLDALDALLSFLQSYVSKHFYDEEALQLKYEYPKYSAHKMQHEKLIDDLVEKELKTRLQIKKLDLQNDHQELQRIFATLIDWLEAWVRHHIAGSDKEVGKYLTSKGFSGTQA